MISIFRGQPKFQANPESYNGAVRENYSWSQDYMDVEVRVFVSKSVLKGRQVNTHTHTHTETFSPPSSLLAARFHGCLSLSRLSSGQCQHAAQQHQSVCEGWGRGENADGGRIHSQDKHGKLPVESRARPLCGREYTTETHTQSARFSFYGSSRFYVSWLHLSPSCPSVRRRRFGGTRC